MKTTFHAILATRARHNAMMLAEPLLGRQMGAEAADILARNLRAGYLERTMPVVDALIHDIDPTGRIVAFSYDEVMTEATPEQLERSARRAAAAVPAGTVIASSAEVALADAIAAELTYLWLRSCEPLYARLAKAEAA